MDTISSCWHALQIKEKSFSLLRSFTQTNVQSHQPAKQGYTHKMLNPLDLQFFQLAANWKKIICYKMKNIIRNGAQTEKLVETSTSR